MLFRQKFLRGIWEGTVTLAFRRWRRPTVRSGGTLLTAVGELHIGTVSRIEIDQITAADAQSAGFDTLQEMITELKPDGPGELYRIELGPLRPDPRLALRESIASGTELRDLQKRVQRLDAPAGERAWTRRVLELLAVRPGVRAGDLFQLVDQEKQQFKLNVRKLKNLGLTESLGTGYRLSPRGAALLDVPQSEDSVG